MIKPLINLITLLFFSVLFSTVATAFHKGADENTDTAVRFQRANYVVSDLDRALRVYEGILGLKVVSLNELAAGDYGYEVFGVDSTAKIRAATLSSPTQTRVMGLTEVKGMEMKPSALPYRAAIVLDVADYDGVIARAHAEGLEVFSVDHLVTGEGRIGRQQGFLDHDGHLIVIYKLDD